MNTPTPTKLRASAPISLMRWAGHSHVCRTTTTPTRTLAEQVEFLKHQGLDYFGLGHPWEPWDLELIREWELNPIKKKAYREEEVWKFTDPSGWLRNQRFTRWKRQFSSNDFIFGVDLESPKIRFGHLWWLGWEPETAPWHDYDSDWTKWEVQRTGPKPPFRLRMPSEVIRIQSAYGALPVYAHPTSWWVEKNQHISNISSTLIPDLLTQQSSGCLVVMGYEADHAHYQELWFELLNQGYFMTGVAETDACLDLENPFERAVFHNIASVDHFTLAGIKTALKRGHNVMTTGPYLRIQCGDAISGDRVSDRGGNVFIHVNGLENNHSYHLSIIHNGKTIREHLITGVPEWEETFEHDGRGWLVAKIVNRSEPYSAALTNPIFFDQSPFRVTGHALPREEIRWWEIPGAMDLAYYLAEGQWRQDFPGRNPGELPWEAFRWADWKSLLSSVS